MRVGRRCMFSSREALVGGAAFWHGDDRAAATGLPRCGERVANVFALLRLLPNWPQVFSRDHRDGLALVRGARQALMRSQSVAM